MKKITLLFSFFTFLGLLISSCAPKQILYKSGNFHSPDLNKIVNAEIGESVYSVQDLVYTDGIRIVDLIDTNGIFDGKYPYSVGETIPLGLIKDDFKAYFHTNNLIYKNFGVVVFNNGDVQPMYMIGNRPVISKKGSLKIDYTKHIDNNCSKCFKQEFIYNGKVNNSLKFIYREYKNDMARPAFTQELQYDLNEGNIIGFKGLRIEILKSTNTNIEYKVQSTINK